jgi:hypothetical protein
MRYRTFLQGLLKELVIMTQIPQRKRKNNHVMMIWSPRLVPTLNNNKTKQGKEVKMQPMFNLLLFPIHVGVPPLHKRNKNQMLAEKRIMKDMLEETMRMTHPLLILKELIQYLNRKGREAQARRIHRIQKSQEMQPTWKLIVPLVPDWVALRIVENQ